MKTNRRKATILLILVWIIACAMLYGAGMWLRNANEETGAYFLFVGLLPVSIYFAIRIAKVYTKK